MTDEERAMADAVRAAMVGLGWWGNRLANAIASTKDMELVACFSRTPSSRADFAERHGCAAECGVARKTASTSGSASSDS